MHNSKYFLIAILFFLDKSLARREPHKTVRTYRTNGEDEVDIIIEDTAVTDQCYQYTWVGVEKGGQNGTGSFTSCLDLESDVGV